MKYIVKIIETYEKNVIVDADCESDAIDEVKQSYWEGEIELDNSNFKDIDFCSSHYSI
jgi:hypothetical protein